MEYPTNDEIYFSFFFLEQTSAKEDDEAVVRIQDGSTCCYKRRNWSLYLFSPSNRYTYVERTIMIGNVRIT